MAAHVRTLALALVALWTVTLSAADGDCPGAVVKPATLPWELVDKKIMLRAGASPQVLVDAAVESACGDEDIVYYIRRPDALQFDHLYAGSADLAQKKILSEKKLPFSLSVQKVKKTAGLDGALFLLIAGENKKNPGGTLRRLSLNTMEWKDREGVIDFALFGTTLVIIEKDESGYVAVINGARIELALGGVPFIKGRADERLLLVSDCGDTEVLDLKLAKSLYVYSDKNEFLQPDDFNMVIEARDLYEGAAPPAPVTVYYRVFIDNEESGRTETGESLAPKTFREYAEADTLHSIRLERWELDRNKSAYVRVNNINQPQPFRLYLPENRVVKISVVYNGKTYRFSQSVLRK